MFLNIWDSIREYFSNAFANFSIGYVITLIMGIVLGFIIALLVYVISVLKGIHDTEKKITKEENEANKEKGNQVNNIINNSISRYDDMSKDASIKERYEITKDVIATMVYDISKTYYPDSKHPLAELTIEEVIELDRYVADRVEGLFNRRALKSFKKKRISEILKAKDFISKIDENRFVKTAQKFHFGSVGEIFTSIKNAINPAYWGKKTTNLFTKIILINKIAKLVINIVGNGAAMVYSKHMYETNEEKIDREADIIEAEIINEDN